VQCSQQEVRLRRELEQPRGGRAAEDGRHCPRRGASKHNLPPLALGEGLRWPREAATPPQPTRVRLRRVQSRGFVGASPNLLAEGLCLNDTGGKDGEGQWKQRRSTAPATREPRSRAGPEGRRAGGVPPPLVVGQRLRTLRASASIPGESAHRTGGYTAA
jgi:hypothetical protein